MKLQTPLELILKENYYITKRQIKWSLQKNVKIKSVEVLGSNAKVEWKLTSKGFELESPPKDGFEYARVYKINTIK